METRGAAVKGTATPALAAKPSPSCDWREQLPVLAGSTITLRELELRDAPSLLAMLSTEEVTRFSRPRPATIEAAERFIASAREERQRGRYLCFGVVPHDLSVAVGLFELRRMDSGFGVARWKFALGSTYWGTGMFLEGARMTVDFAISTLGVHRLEARVVTSNGRANGALKKLGAVRECLLRSAFSQAERYLDEHLWAIVDTEWLRAKPRWGPMVRVH